MTDAPHPLLAGIIDYAGLFPPARLPMDEAFRRFLAHRSGADGRLIARFVCPAVRLPELAPLIEDVDRGAQPVPIAVLGTGGDDPPAFAASIESDAELVRAFTGRSAGAAVVDAFEVKLPAEGHPSEVVDLCFHHLADLAAETPAAFFETPLVGAFPDPGPVALAIAAAGHEIDPVRRAGLKIRCGGLAAAAVPDVEAVAAAVIAARGAGLPLKATQGLHHPFRRPDAELGATVHGFVNLAAAALLARRHGLDETTVRAILAEEEPGAFRLDRAGLAWRDLAVDPRSIADGRTVAFTGFGSCSFAEPRDDLAALGWI
ncbi:MAG: hypothetical protein MUC56_09340 [Thermoanaerobaculales bacterium]|jgi:hypothetical protein|nr:hypothetical protein [Thermoanaerobaculales bacterium]